MFSSCLPRSEGLASAPYPMLIDYVGPIYIIIVKGALDNFSLIPQFFFKKVEIFIPLEVYTYVVTTCLILLATST